MKRYFLHLRVHRKRDHQYWVLYLRVDTRDLTSLEATIQAYGEGLKVAGAEVIGLDHIYFDFPQGSVPAEDYHPIEDPYTFGLMYKFLQLRDRRIKQEKYTTEDNPNGTDV